MSETYNRIECARAEDFCEALPDGCANLIVTDPPYHKVKSEAWDNQWKSDDDFLDWIGARLKQWRLVLAPNGSLYVFASPQMGARVECKVREQFEVLCNIRWAKPPHSTKAEMFVKEDLRAPFPASETVIFAEQRGSDDIAMGGSGYDAACGEAHKLVFGRVFGDYLRNEIRRAGITNREIAALFPSRSGGFTGCVSNWLLGYNCPTRDQYIAIRERLNCNGAAEFLRREYEDLRREYEDLRREYEDLRREYEDLRRPFTVSADVPYTDVWTYETVCHYDGKHPCEKPDEMALDIVSASSRPGDLVCDFFAGSGKFLWAAQKLGRRYVGCDMSEHWVERARRLVASVGNPALTTRRVLRVNAPRALPGQLSLLP